MGVGAESFQGNEIREQSNCFLFRFKTLTNNIKPSRNQELLDHCKVPKNPNKFYFILFFQKEGGLLRKQKTHHVTQMPQAMQNMKTQMNAAAAAAENLSLEINSSIRRRPKFHSKGPESSSSSSLFPSLKCLSNSIL